MKIAITVLINRPVLLIRRFANVRIRSVLNLANAVPGIKKMIINNKIDIPGRYVFSAKKSCVPLI